MKRWLWISAAVLLVWTGQSWASGLNSAESGADALAGRWEGQEDFNVVYSVREQSVYVDFFAKDYSFVNSADQSAVKIAVFLDGSKISMEKTAAFSLKNLSPGKHLIKLELLQGDGVHPVYKTVFPVHIQRGL